MRVLIACESSGRTRDSFRRRGHVAMSCDLLACETGGPHYQGDVRDILHGAYFCPCGYIFEEGLGKYGCPNCEGDNTAVFARWDLMIAHPDCTYLTCSAEWAYKDPDFERYPDVGYHQKVKPETLTGAERRDAREKALQFVRLLMDAPIDLVAIENPRGVISTRIRPADQYIQPYEYGEDASKITGLWLKGLPKLQPTKRCKGRMVEWPPGSGKIVERWSNQTDGGQNKLSPSDNRWRERARTYQGWSDAFADQWGGIKAGHNGDLFL